MGSDSGFGNVDEEGLVREEGFENAGGVYERGEGKRGVRRAGRDGGAR